MIIKTMFGWVFLLLLSSCLCGDCPCENGGVCQDNSTSVCVCKPDFIGENCSFPARPLSTTEQDIRITENYTYVYFMPEDLSFYSINLTFCLKEKVPNYVNEIYFSIEGTNGEFTPNNKENKKLFVLQFGDNSCIVEESRYIWYKRKINGQIPKIIMGIRIRPQTNKTQSPAQSHQSVTEVMSIQCQIDEIFNFNILVRIIFIFFGVIASLMFISLAYVLIQKYRKYRQNKREKMKNINLIKKIMPSKKYSNLVEEIQKQTQICSICLANFQKDDTVRKTPCQHIFHQQCLDSWCRSHLNCPICRTDIEELNNRMVELNETKMVRQPML